MDTAIPNEWTVEVVTKGPHGHILYHEGAYTASLYWQFGGGHVIVIINGAAASEWNEKYPWAAGRQRQVLERVIGEVIRQKAPSCTAEIDETTRVIYLRERKQPG